MARAHPPIFSKDFQYFDQQLRSPLVAQGLQQGLQLWSFFLQQRQEDLQKSLHEPSPELIALFSPWFSQEFSVNHGKTSQTNG
jgi:hypothetical protein